MKHGSRVVAFAIVVVASGCEPAAPPPSLAQTSPGFAGGPRGRFRSFRIPTDNSQPRHMTLGSDGNMWFTKSEIDVSQIGRIDSDGSITEFVVPTRFSQPSDIVSGADGAA